MGARVRLYKPAKSAMQSGRGKSRGWLLTFEPSQPQLIDSLMGWSGSGDMNRQVRLSFATKEEALAYVERNGLDVTVFEPERPAFERKPYAEKFAYRKNP